MSQKLLPELSVFFPAYNEKENIRLSVEEARKLLPLFAQRYEVVIIDDGSKDGTKEAADELARKYADVRAVHHDRNRGYGMALRSGFKNSLYRYVFFTDSDRQFDLNEIAKLLPLIEDADIATGIRVKRNDPFYRRLNAKMYNVLIRLLFGLRARDIDCAFKLIKKEVLDNIELKSESQFVSAEFLIKANKKGYRIRQVGVTHLPRKAGRPTGNSLKAIIGSFQELFKLRRELK